MKRVFTGALTLGAAAALILGISVPHIEQTAQAAAPARSITVSADGKVTIAPDVAMVTVGVQEISLEAAKAQGEANSVTATAIARIKALGIPGRDIQTVAVSLSPQYDDRSALTGFVASDTLSITVEHPAQAGPVIDAAVAAGANQNVGVSFGLKDDSEARSNALRAAVAVAQRKAAAVAAQLGMSLQGAKVQVVENVSQPGPIYETATVGAPARSAPATTPIQAGMLTVQDNVTLTYSL